jgi:hypothetical protein
MGAPDTVPPTLNPFSHSRSRGTLLPDHLTFAVREDPGRARSRTSLPDPKLAVLVPTRGGLRSTEVGFTFADRHAGQSSGTLREGLTYAVVLGDLRRGRATPSPSRSADSTAEAERLAPMAPHRTTAAS